MARRVGGMRKHRNRSATLARSAKRKSENPHNADTQLAILLSKIVRASEKAGELAVTRKNYRDWAKFFNNHSLIISCMTINEVIEILEAHIETLKKRLEILERAAKAK